MRRFGELPVAGPPCEGCGTVQVDTGYGADHCHRHGWVRAVLCQGCNETMKVVDAGGVLDLREVRVRVHGDGTIEQVYGPVPDDRRRWWDALLDIRANCRDCAEPPPGPLT